MIYKHLFYLFLIFNVIESEEISWIEPIEEKIGIPLGHFTQEGK